MAPDALGVLSHYDAVIWETGNDNVTRAAAQPGVAGEEAHLTTMAVRDFVNEGGTVALAGVNAGRQYDLVEYPQDGLPLSTCDGDVTTTTAASAPRSRTTSSSTTWGRTCELTGAG